MPQPNPSTHPPLTADQQAAIEGIEALGGHVFHVLGTNQQVVETISLRGPQFTDQQLALLTPFRGYDLYSFGVIGARLTEEGACRAIDMFPTLKSFTAMDVPLGDKVVASLTNANNLVSVTLRNTQVTSAGARMLAGLADLETINLTASTIDDSGLENLGCFSKLKWLSLGDTKITSDGIRPISNLTTLETLLVNGTEIADDGPKWLTPLKDLHSLRLDGTRITDAGLVHLKDMPKLKYLVLDNTAITDAGLKHIQNLPKLDDISMRGTKVTRKGGDRFVLYLPANKERFRKQRERFERGEWPLD